MTDAGDPLAALRPIRMPVLDLAVGEQLLVAVLLGLASAIVLNLFLALKRRRVSARGPEAELLAALRASKPADAAESLAELAAALRSYVARRENAEIASAQGERWLACLDCVLDTDFFSKGEGAVFGGGLYTSRIEVDPKRIGVMLQKLVRERWR